MYLTVSPDWRESPASPNLPSGQVHIWRIHLNQSVPVACRNQLPAMSSVSRRDAAGCAMREILARYLGVAADRLVIERHSGGKPYLSSPGPTIEFNLSHSMEVALLAVSRDCSVGVDIETMRRVHEPVRLARRALPAAEAAELAALPEHQRTARLLDLWTRMEARQKALGRGIFAEPADPGEMSNISFSPGPGLFASLSLAPVQQQPNLRFFVYRPR
jgi:4'-phosphopantetheinyl transferase